MIQINNLTAEQVEMLEIMWEIKEEREYFEWYSLLDEEDQKMADGLQRLIILEVMEEVVEQTKYKDAKAVLKKFALQKQIMYNKTLKPRNLVAKDLRTPKYRMRTVESKVKYIRNPKHRKEEYGL